MRTDLQLVQLVQCLARMSLVSQVRYFGHVKLKGTSVSDPGYPREITHSYTGPVNNHSDLVHLNMVH